MRKPVVLATIIALGLTACGATVGTPATATQGDAFCKLAQTAKDDNDNLDALDGSDATKLKLELGAAIDSLNAAVAKAPKDIVATAQELLTKEEQLETLLKKYGYDISKMSASDEGKKLIDDKSAKTAGDEFDRYLSDKCGIPTSSTTPTDTTPIDTTPVDTTSSNTSAAGDTSVDTIVDLGEGADAINKFLDYYELGTGAKLTSTERTCIVDYLVDKVTGSELNHAIVGQSSPELQQALGLAFITCNVTVASTP
ncbi:MAG: hypothetical protein QOE00_350 [Ilumatobacteraceae bacterium]|jgi:hypothetical protein